MHDIFPYRYAKEDKTDEWLQITNEFLPEHHKLAAIPLSKKEKKLGEETDFKNMESIEEKKETQREEVTSGGKREEERTKFPELFLPFFLLFFVGKTI